MARPLRIEFAGALYHVMARGNQRRVIFRDDKDYVRFLETLGEACQKTGWRIYAYVLMANHYHLLLETPEANLVAGMKWLQGTYTQRYNCRHQLCGHLFQGRYKAVPVEGRGYFGVVSTYIHLNPARAGLISIGKEPLKKYRWSSYPAYVSRAGKGPSWLCREPVMEELGLAKGAVKGYEAYMEGRVLELGMKAGRKEWEEKWKELRRGWYVGGEGFLERLGQYVKRAAGGRRRESHSGPARRAHDEKAAEELLQRGLRLLGIKEAEHKPKWTGEKVALAWWLRERTTVSLRWVSQRLGMGHYSRVSQAVSRMRRRPGRKLEKLKAKLMQAEP
ncbi:MAG: transposase [Verrucomicrobiota bacterium]|jgi:REP element-mobilizing transposase RayT